MIDAINAILATLALGALAFRLAQLRHWHGRFVARHGWILAHALLGVGLVGAVMSALTGQTNDAAGTSLYAGLALLLLVRWQRRLEDRRP